MPEFMMNPISPKAVAIIGGRRTPFVKAGTVFESLSAVELATHTINSTLDSLPIREEDIDHVVMGTAIPTAGVSNLARQAVLESGLPATTRALTVSDNCISGITAVSAVFEEIALGRKTMGIAGGVESMSHMPPGGGLKEPATGLSMGEHTELTVKHWSISREAQDQYSLNSHLKAAEAEAQGLFVDEVAPLAGTSSDRQIREDTTAQKLAALAPVFDPTLTGTITAGNASPLTDGAVSVLLMENSQALRRGLKPLALIRDFEFAAIDPSEGLLMAPAIAVPRLLQRNGLTLGDVDVLEVHEAFAGQVLANIKAWETGWKAPSLGPVDFSKLNPKGSSIALGHPLGATGARIVLTLAHTLDRHEMSYGLISICAAGGQAAAMLLEHPSINQ